MAARLLGLWVRIPQGHGCLFLVLVGCCQLEVSVSGRSLVQSSPTECGVSECDRGTSQRRSKPTETVQGEEEKKNKEYKNMQS